MAATLEGVFRPRSKSRETITWSELLPRYLLVEGALAKKRVLEIGTIDPRSLLRIHDAKAVRVVGTSPDVGRFEPALFRGRRIEALPMESGRIDFDDRSFDAVLVADLGAELAANARFLEELKRVLAPDGFCALAYQANGRSLLELVEDNGAMLLLEPSRVEDAIREALPRARFYHQLPFVGVTIEPEDAGTEGGVSLEPSTGGVAPRPSHVIALWGRSAPLPEERTLVELPFTELEAVTEAAHARASHDLSRALTALRDAKKEIERRDHSLRLIGERLPKLRAAIEARAGTAPSPAAYLAEGGDLRSLVHRVEEARDALRTKLDRLERDLEGERAKNRTLEQRVHDLEASAIPMEIESAPPSPRVLVADLDSGIHDTRIERAPQPLQRMERDYAELERDAAELRERAEYHEGEASDLRTRVDELEAQLVARNASAEAERAKLQEQIQALRTRDADRDQELLRAKEKTDKLALDLSRERAEQERSRRSGRSEADGELQEAQRRVLQLERTASMQELRIDELRQELESQLLVRHSIGSDYRDAEARIAYLQRKLEDTSFELHEQLRLANARQAAVSDALSRVDHERDTLRARTNELEKANTELNERADRAERALSAGRADQREHERLARVSIRELDSIREEAHTKGEELTWLRRTLGERDAEVQKLRADKASLETDKRAVELAAQHFGQEVHALRIKNQALTYERDTLATTSRMLLEERDAAAAMARRTIGSEERASNLSQSLEGAQAAIERLESALQESLDRERSAKARIDAVEGDRANLSGELDRARLVARDEAKRAERADRERVLTEARVKELDQHLAEAEHRWRAGEHARDAQLETTRNLENVLRDAGRAVADAEREVQVWKLRTEELLRAAADAEQERGRLLSERAESEARAAEVFGRCVEAEGACALLRAALASLEAKQAAAQATPQKVVSSAQLEGLEAEKRNLERALSRTLEEAAQLSIFARELELTSQAAQEQLARGERERLLIERQRRAAEEAREAAEEARQYLVAEVHALRQQLAPLEMERNELIRAVESLEQTRRAQEHALERARAETHLAARDDAARKAESDAHQKRVHALEEEIEALRSGALARRDEEQALRARLATLERERTELGASARALVETRDLLAAATDRLRALEASRGDRMIHELAERAIRGELETEVVLLRARVVQLSRAAERSASADAVALNAHTPAPRLREERVLVGHAATGPRVELEDRDELEHARLERAQLERAVEEARAAGLADRVRAEELEAEVALLRARGSTRTSAAGDGADDHSELERLRMIRRVQDLEDEIERLSATASFARDDRAGGVPLAAQDGFFADAELARLEREVTEQRATAVIERERAQELADELARLQARSGEHDAELGRRDMLERLRVAELEAEVERLRVQGARVEELVAWRNTLEQRNTELEGAVLHASEELDAIKEELAQARAAVERVRREWDLEIERLEREREDAEVQSASLRDELKQNNERMADVEARHAFAESLAQSHDERARGAEMRVAALELERVRLEDRAHELSVELEALRAQASTEVAALQASLEQAEVRAQASDGEVRSLRDALAAAGERVHQAESSGTELEAQVRASAAESAALRASLEAATEKLRVLGEQSDALRARLADSDALVREANDDAASVRAQLVETEVLAQDTAREVEVLRAELAEARARGGEETATLRAELERASAEAREQATTLRRELDQVKAAAGEEAATLRALVEEARGLAASHEADAEELRASFVEADNRARANEAQANEHRASLADALERERAAEDEGLALRQKLAALEQRISANAGEAAALRTAQNEAGERERALSAELSKARMKLSDTEARAESADQHAAQLKAALIEADRRARSTNEELAVLRNGVEESHQRAREHEAESNALRAMLAKTEERTRAVESEANRIRIDLEISEAHAKALNDDASDLRVSYDEVLAQTRTLESENADLRSSRAALETRAQAAEEEAAAARANLEDTAERARVIAREHAELQARLREFDGLAERARITARDHAELQTRFRDAETRIAELDRSLNEVEARAGDAEAKLRAAEERIREAAKQGGPVPSDDLRRLAARAHEAEDRAERAESQAAQAQALADQNNLRAAQAEARAGKGEERADRAEAALRKTEARTRQAEDRATQAEATAHQSEQRARDAEGKQRNIEALAGDAEERAAFAERRARDAETALRAAEARATAAGAGEPIRVSQLEQQLREAKARVETLEGAVNYRDGELKRLKGQSEETAAQLDHARAEVGRKLTELRTLQHAVDNAKAELSTARSDADVLRTKLARQGDADTLKGEVEQRDHAIARMSSEAGSRAAEVARLRSLLQRAEQSQVLLERRLVELEASVTEGNQKIEMLKREVADKTERLRRLSGLPE